MHLDILVEEPSMKAALENILPRMVRSPHECRVIAFQGKKDLLKNLPDRLRAYSRMDLGHRTIMVLVDRDRDDCLALKIVLEATAAQCHLSTKTSPSAQGGMDVVNRIAVEELESWFFGDVEAICEAFPGVPRSLGARARYRDPDAIVNAWEALERVLKKAGYYKAGLAKIDAATKISSKMEPRRNVSRSFQCFAEGISAALGQ